jgi:hypothetical protein
MQLASNAGRTVSSSTHPMMMDGTSRSSGPRMVEDAGADATSKLVDAPTLNILLAIADDDRRFRDAGYVVPMPLMPVHGVPAIDLIVPTLRPSRRHHFILVASQEQLQNRLLVDHLERTVPGCTILPATHGCAGTAGAIVSARELIDSDDRVMVATCGQWIDLDIDEYLAAGDSPSVDGVIMTMASSDARWPYAAIDDDWSVESVNLGVVSSYATIGIESFRRGRDAVRAVSQVLAVGPSTGQGASLAGACNLLIAEGQRFVPFGVGREGERMFPLATPQDLQAFIGAPASRRAARLSRTDYARVA